MSGTALARAVPGLFLGAAAFLLLVVRTPLGFTPIAAALLAAWWCDRSGRSQGLLPDLSAAASGLAVLTLTDLAADLSDLGMLRFTLVLGGAVVVPQLVLRLTGREPVRFPWGGWRWNRAQWSYLAVVVVAGYLILPWYFLSSGVYHNWPAIHDAQGVFRLFVGVNAVGIWDELFFICTVFALYRRHLPLWQANALQAMVFVSFLWELGYQSWGPVLTIPFAVVQGAIFQLTKNLTYVIVVHLLFDLVVFLVLVHGHNPSWPHPFVLLPAG